MCFHETGCSMSIGIARYERWLFPYLLSHGSFQNTLWSSYTVLVTAMLPIPVAEHTSSVLQLHRVLMWNAPSACWCKNNSFLLPIEHRSCRVARSVFSVLHFWAFSFLSPKQYFDISHFSVGILFSLQKKSSVNLLSSLSGSAAIFKSRQGFLFHRTTQKHELFCCFSLPLHIHQLTLNTPSAFWALGTIRVSTPCAL